MRPTSGQRKNADANDKPAIENEEDLEEQCDPANQIVDFDWEDLAVRYHHEMRQCQQHEEDLLKEYGELMDFFRVWVESGHAHETDRTYHRLRTRMTHVQSSEEHLEKTRNHYINVVKAFESALNLLNS
ncbi:uncharacterized protein BDR25DRAFT_305154 [Lindgomyces ingoldianus]|uniref:Uncharacterized protein n=1 Tax=Lindgomyces ingoldianus TaxID=673940 RepID=A0ACB6QML8_9PLEO|nr:uncharacterized protein BDR25DRAFT_305154 [Lindgomyces ingoldianus]KAF2468151.1 hypothetical protein BDR25DRAFT_305154 [Lindgomyces ingoldianus]